MNKHSSTCSWNYKSHFGKLNDKCRTENEEEWFNNAYYINSIRLISNCRKIKLWMKLRWWHIEVEKPWYDECENHTSKEKIQEAMPVPKSLSFWCRRSGWERGRCGGIVTVNHMLCRILVCTINIPRNRMTNFTGPT